MTVRTRVWAKRLSRGALALAGIAALFLTVILPVGGSFLITNPRLSRRALPSPPAGAEAVSFTTGDGIALDGWWIPGRGGVRGAIVFVHGLNRSREEMLDRAEAIRPDGYALLLFDLRNHGASADAHTTLGVHERRDVCRAAAFARSRAEGPLVIWGVSMGAAAALLGAGCADADRVIAESAFDSLRNTVGHHLREGFGLPAFPAADLLVGVTGLRTGFAVREGDVGAAVAELGELPILFVAGGADWRMPPEISRGLLEASSSPRSRLYIVESAGHGRAWEVDPRGYLAAVRAFLADGTGPSPADPAPTLY